MIVLKAIGYIFGAIFLVSLLMVAYLITRWVFIDKFSLLSTHFSKDIAWQAPDVELQEQAPRNSPTRIWTESPGLQERAWLAIGTAVHEKAVLQADEWPLTTMQPEILKANCSTYRHRATVAWSN